FKAARRGVREFIGISVAFVSFIGFILFVFFSFVAFGFVFFLLFMLVAFSFALAVALRHKVRTAEDQRTTGKKQNRDLKFPFHGFKFLGERHCCRKAYYKLYATNPVTR